MKEISTLYLEDILEAIEKIFMYTGGLTEEDFLKDEKTQDAVIRQITIIGEAANKVMESVKKEIPIP